MPEVEGIGKHDVAEDLVLWPIADVEGRIELKIPRQITGEPERH